MSDSYDLYRCSDEIGQAMTMVGYGIPGTGTSEQSTTYTAELIRKKANNQF